MNSTYQYGRLKKENLAPIYVWFLTPFENNMYLLSSSDLRKELLSYKHKKQNPIRGLLLPPNHVPCQSYPTN